MAFQRAFDGSDPLRAEPVTRLGGTEEERRALRSGRMASGTLACPVCDAPVSPGDGHLSPADRVGCPFCGHAAPVRDFLSLEPPTRPARVAVRVVQRRP
jgi:hypothetical protein